VKELHQIDDLRQAKALLHPWRVAILGRLREPKTCLELAEALGVSQQRVNNYVKELLRAGLVEKVASRQKRNVLEAVYHAVGRRYWLSPRLAEDQSAEVAHDGQALHNLLQLSERLQDDASRLFERLASERVPSIGLTAEVTLRTDEERAAFAKDLVSALHGVLEKYQSGGRRADAYTAMVVCYPKPGGAEDAT
jgi:DNA-binding transcriptional ArsR family regulator